MNQKFNDEIAAGYTFAGSTITLGAGVYANECQQGLLIKAPLRTFNRHGLIAGATGTGKTKTLQNISESLSLSGVPVLLMDIKGDLSGLAKPAEPNAGIQERHEKMGIPYAAAAMPIELYTISNDKGARMRATVSEFGPVLLSKILELNDTQSSVVSLVFKICDDNQWPLLDLKDFNKVLQYVSGDGKETIAGQYGTVSPATVGTISRKIIELEQQGATAFFGETSFDINDLLRKDADGRGYISVLRLTDIQSRPKLFSTFMLSLLAEIYQNFPEQGDADKPKLVIFIDEAHLIFSEASKALLDQIESIVKLIRSKGVGLFFVTQTPTDIPDAVLGQLGMKIQHALRAFTAKDRQSIRLTAQNYPETNHYDVEELITSLGIGEALVTVLSEKGMPTPLVHTMMHAPRTRMGILTDAEMTHILNNSQVATKYNQEIDRHSAFEILNGRMQETQAQKEAAEQTEAQAKTTAKAPAAKAASKEKEWYENPMVRTVGNTLMREVTRGLLGALGFKRR
jgi:DNA helicase HerA-like ATPase